MVEEKKGLMIYPFIQDTFGELFKNPKITEFAVNKFGEFWYEESGVWKKVICENVSESSVYDFCSLLATDTRKTFDNYNTENTKNLVFSTSMPDTYERVQVVAPPVCDSSSFSITIRKPSKVQLKLEMFNEILSRENLNKIKLENSNSDNHLINIFSTCESYTTFLKEAVINNKNIVIAGGTGSGKTTLMKSLIEYIPINERIITIEDAPEINFTEHENYVKLFYESENLNENSVNAQSLLKSCLRMKPDRIILTELRGGETFDYINVISSGHGGSITSIHAENVDQAFSRLQNMFFMNDTAKNYKYEEVQKLIQNNIDIIICIKAHNGKRFIKDIYYKDFDNKVN